MVERQDYPYQEQSFTIYSRGEVSSPLVKNLGRYSLRKSKSFDIDLDKNLSLEELMALIEALQGKAGDFLRQYRKENGGVGGRRYRLYINIQAGLILEEQ